MVREASAVTARERGVVSRIISPQMCRIIL
jgi:hypothetical protein